MNIHHFEYALVLVLVSSIPLAISLFHPDSPFRGKWKTVITSISVVAIAWVISDTIQTTRGHWSFNPEYVTGLYIFNLPVEEVAFFFVVPFACLFTWTVVRDFINWKTFLQRLRGNV